ncbi:hypothetical protein COU76_00675 [Candidatus Peregrinibacteria bacterium CG10_big_fil_rev_8_21_14_0_10_49_10]|nr:MAG: hypothetical protein COU76_00675 [Candidatus Peregrinibacteria bacterium CG10_big_fil_rev_8_21_14_0_10_49_10]
MTTLQLSNEKELGVNRLANKPLAYESERIIQALRERISGITGLTELASTIDAAKAEVAALYGNAMYRTETEQLPVVIAAIDELHGKASVQIQRGGNGATI